MNAVFVEPVVAEIVLRGHPEAVEAVLDYLRRYFGASNVSMEVTGQFEAADYDDPEKCLARARQLVRQLEGGDDDPEPEFDGQDLLEPGETGDEPFECGVCGLMVTKRTGRSSPVGTVHPECFDSNW